MRLDAIAAPMGMRLSSGTVYLGERTSHDGSRELVAVTACECDSRPDIILQAQPNLRAGVEVVARALKEGNLMTAPSETSEILYGYGGGYGAMLPHAAPVVIVNPEIVVHSAKEDPADPAHFQFFYDLESERVLHRLLAGQWRRANGRLDPTPPHDYAVSGTGGLIEPSGKVAGSSLRISGMANVAKNIANPTAANGRM